jgi:hypothetical protein
MRLIQRLGYYLGGFSIGLIILAFFLSGKKTSCAYGPNARVLKNINTKQLVYSDLVEEVINSKLIDTASISLVLNKGSVNFSESNTKLDSCRIYVIEEEINNKEIALTIENCDSIATLKQIDIK